MIDGAWQVVSVRTAWRLLSLSMWKIAANVLNEQQRTAEKGCGPPGWGFGEG